MRKIKALGLFALAGLALGSSALVGCSSKGESITEKHVYGLNEAGEVKSFGNCSVLFKNNSTIPYISLNEGVDLMNMIRKQRAANGSVKLSKDGNNFVVTNELGAKCVANPEKQTLSYSDFDKFGSIVPVTQSPLTMVTISSTAKCLKEVSNTYTAGNEVNIDLNSYSLLDLYVKDDTCYLPLSVYNSALLNTGENINLAYNGVDFFIIVGNSLVYNIGILEEQSDLGVKFFEGAAKSEISTEFSEYNYQSLCFDFDHDYGLRDKFKSFSEFLTKDFKENILSTNPRTIDTYSAAAVSYLSDGHTALNGFSNLYEYGTGKKDKTLSNPIMDNWVDLSNAYAEARLAAKIKDGLEYKNDTAFVTFSSFTGLDEDLLYTSATQEDSDEDFPSLDFAGSTFNVATNTGTLFSQLYKDLTSDTYKNTIKNIVVDLTTNDGGNADGLTYALSTLIGQVSVDIVNPISGGHNKQVYMADINTDGKIDSNDKSLSDLGFKIYFLDSKYSFSSANAMPVIAKLNNPKVITLGEKTGGGPCAVRINISPIGSVFSSSSLNCISKLVDGKYVNIDDGVEADFKLSESQMIDRTYIVNNIKNWVK